MKITRSQLRRLILESVISEVRIKPGGDIDPELFDKMKKAYATDDEYTTRQIDALAYDSEQHGGPHLSQDIKYYDQLSIMGATGDFAHYLTDEDKQMLMKAAGRNLTYWLDSFAGFGFSDARSAVPIVPPDDLYDMAMRIALKKQDITEADRDKNEGTQNFIDALDKLVVAIITLSNKTEANSYDAEDAGIGEVTEGYFNFYEPYKSLYEAGQLIVQEIQIG